MPQTSTPVPDNAAISRRLAVFPQRSFGETNRKDLWWLQPLAVFLGFMTFIVYSTWAAFQGTHYWFGPYLSPFYSPLLFGGPTGPHGLFGIHGRPEFLPSWAPWSAALFILWGPGGFRFTCYYYRGAYYKAFWADPISCAVGEPRKSYWGENRLPLILQNVHRYFMYVAVIFLALLAYDVWEAMWFADGAGKTHFGIGVGTIILAVNVCLLSSYTFGCHSFRHLVGGWRDSLSRAPKAAKTVYDCSSCLNKRHMMFAWLSLFTVGFSDVYIRLCSMGIWQDLHWSLH